MERLGSGGWSGVGGMELGSEGFKSGVGEVKGVRGVGGIWVEGLGWDWGGRRGWRVGVKGWVREVEVGALGELGSGELGLAREVGIRGVGVRGLGELGSGGLG